MPSLDLGIHVFEERYRALAAHALSGTRTFGVILESHRVGTVAQICGHAMLPDGRYLIEVEGTRRFRVHARSGEGAFPTAEVSFISETIGNFGSAKAQSAEATRLLRLYRSANGDGDRPFDLPVDPVARSYVIASLVHVGTLEKQRLLELPSAEERLNAVREILQRELALLDHLPARR